ncbi:hypothetical protein AYO45_05600 [Gammaproteobacteria bacterium SCGC AG-212-F23]|nr:hypothetical protein AYO45_05600 [Gammaproteobacteria bacterium SCGC AG-212-F23]
MNIVIRKKYPFLILIIMLGCIFLAKIWGVIINITPSMREGIYIRTYGEIKRGDIVAACLKDPYKTIGLKQLYIEKGSKCSGADPIVKKIIAIPGDNVRLTDKYIQVNNTILSFPTVTKDSVGRGLNSYPRGNYLHVKGYWLIGTNSPNSWDSRYWGSVEREQILYKIKLITEIVK